VGAARRVLTGGGHRRDTLKPPRTNPPDVQVTAEVVGEGTHALDLDDDATYADVCHAVGYSPHEVAVLVDDRPVPADRPVDATEVRVVRLLHGG
jgi:sulfur carrier protein